MPVTFPFDESFCRSFFVSFSLNAGGLPGESACILKALSIWGIATSTAFSLLVGLQGLGAPTWIWDLVCCMGFWTAVARSVGYLDELSRLYPLFVLFSFSTSSMVSFFPAHRDIVTSFLYGKSVVSPG